MQNYYLDIVDSPKYSEPFKDGYQALKMYQVPGPESRC